MTNINTPERSEVPETRNRIASAPTTPEDQKNLQRYVHLVWRIYQRRRSDTIDRKSRDR